MRRILSQRTIRSKILSDSIGSSYTFKSNLGNSGLWDTMKQLTQKLKTGKMKILEVPVPVLKPGTVLVKNHYSLISAGTEGSTVKAARKGYIGKAKERPQQVKQVIDTLKSQGPLQTYRAVMKKLDAYSPLGYSCVGEVIDVAEDVRDFHVGNLVACGGITAGHAEYVAVPEKLCVKLQKRTEDLGLRTGGKETDADKENFDRLLQAAAYNTLGAIAMQGVRQADLRLGETCAVIGLGLLGQLTAILLKASGVKVVGIDIDQAMVDVAEKHCVDLALNRDEAGIVDRIQEFSDGLGCDAVIISAATASLDPINFAGAISRKKGTVVVLGAVPTGFDREPHYYKKELQVKMSCSYGPGRYDPEYEEKGNDYPPEYVRWTENRNMQAFQDLVFSGKIDLGYLTTHLFSINDAPTAYDIILNKSELFIGILIKYEPYVPGSLESRIQLRSFGSQRSSLSPETVSIAFIGAGSYAQSHLLPNIPKRSDILLKGVLTAQGTSSRTVADRFGFEFCTGDENEILENKNINTIFITTRHDSHAEYVIKALKTGKNIFVEKPLCITVKELEEITDMYNSVRNSQPSVPLLMVGYNRRFAPFAQRIKREFSEGPMAMSYRINAGIIPPDSWIQDAEIGGGRIVGEVCHFVDFLTFINGSLPVSVNAQAMDDPNNLNDVLNISMKYQNGSIGTISYLANGDKSLPKERVEIFCSGCTAIIDDFRSLIMHTKGRKREKRLLSQDKGQKEEIKRFVDAVKGTSLPPIPIDEILNTSHVCFAALESVRSGQAIKM